MAEGLGFGLLVAQAVCSEQDNTADYLLIRFWRTLTALLLDPDLEFSRHQKQITIQGLGPRSTGPLISEVV